MYIHYTYCTTIFLLRERGGGIALCGVARGIRFSWERTLQRYTVLSIMLKSEQNLVLEVYVLIHFFGSEKINCFYHYIALQSSSKTFIAPRFLYSQFTEITDFKLTDPKCTNHRFAHTYNVSTDLTYGETQLFVFCKMMILRLINYDNFFNKLMIDKKDKQDQEYDIFV